MSFYVTGAPDSPSHIETMSWSLIVFSLFLALVLMMGGGVYCVHFFENYFYSQNLELLEVIKGDQALRHPCKFRNLAIYMACRKCFFSIVFPNLKKVDTFNFPPPHQK